MIVINGYVFGLNCFIEWIWNIYNIFNFKFGSFVLSNVINDCMLMFMFI